MFADQTAVVEHDPRPDRAALILVRNLLDELDMLVGTQVDVDRVHAGFLRFLSEQGVEGDRIILVVTQLVGKTAGQGDRRQLGDKRHRLCFISVEDSIQQLCFQVITHLDHLDVHHGFPGAPVLTGVRFIPRINFIQILIDCLILVFAEQKISECQEDTVVDCRHRERGKTKVIALQDGVQLLRKLYFGSDAV